MMNGNKPGKIQHLCPYYSFVIAASPWTFSYRRGEQCTESWSDRNRNKNGPIWCQQHLSNGSGSCLHLPLRIHQRWAKDFKGTSKAHSIHSHICFLPLYTFIINILQLHMRSLNTMCSCTFNSVQGTRGTYRLRLVFRLGRRPVPPVPAGPATRINLPQELCKSWRHWHSWGTARNVGDMMNRWEHHMVNKCK